MKKAEAISILATSVRPREAKDRERYDKAVNMAIEALKAQELKNVPDTNVGSMISRQAAIDALRNYLVGKNFSCDGTMMARLIENEVINKLPSAQPKNENLKFLEFLWNTINPNEMEQYLEMYSSKEVKSNG